jgi:hypothetical protein
VNGGIMIAECRMRMQNADGRRRKINKIHNSKFIISYDEDRM